MPEKLARSVVVTPCCRHHSLTERPLLRHSWICAAHSCSSARCFNSALVILTPHNTTVAKPFATFRYYCLMCVQPPSALTVTTEFPIGTPRPQTNVSASLHHSAFDSASWNKSLLPFHELICVNLEVLEPIVSQRMKEESHDCSWNRHIQSQKHRCGN